MVCLKFVFFKLSQENAGYLKSQFQKLIMQKFIVQNYPSQNYNPNRMKSQFQKLSNSHQLQKTDQKRKGCESQKLQNLWDKLQDLSEVQDQSRNQQMPMFLDENSMISRQEDNDSFFNTANILNESQKNEGEKQCKSQHRRMRILQKEMINRKSEFQISEQNIVPKYYFQHPPIDTQKQVRQNPTLKNSYQFENGAISKQVQPQKFSSYVSTKQYQIYQNDQHISHPIQDKSVPKVGQNILFEQDTYQQSRKTRKMNDKLLEDNRKLFQECIKLRKQMILNHMQSQNYLRQKINQSHQPNESHANKKLQRQQEVRKQDLIKQQAENIRNLQKQTERLNQKISLIQKYHVEQIIRLKQATRVRQRLLKQSLDEEMPNQTQFLARIHSLEQILKAKQKQISEIGRQKLSRANSVKSTSVSYSGSCQGPNLQVQEGSKFESLLKDKQRQITNMKIVHDSQIKKYQAAIKQYQAAIKQLQAQNNNLS